EDLDGRIEVMVWSNIYTDTRELWQEGNILLVEGKVKLRDDRVQLNCDRARRYQPEFIQVAQSVASQAAEPPIVAEEATASTAPIERRQLVISITQTTDKDSDIAYLHKLIDALQEFPGQDEVNLCVTNEERIINLNLSSMHTDYSPELHKRLVELVGEGGIRVETV
ncbi:OB-fold nucleic acid binding domain-containing protein, partial [Chloroflexota bacterium]